MSITKLRRQSDREGGQASYPRSVSHECEVSITGQYGVNSLIGTTRNSNTNNIKKSFMSDGLTQDSFARIRQSVVSRQTIVALL